MSGKLTKQFKEKLIQRIKDSDIKSPLHNFVAVDKNGTIYAYNKRPRKNIREGIWNANENDTLFHVIGFITKFDSTSWTNTLLDIRELFNPCSCLVKKEKNIIFLKGNRISPEFLLVCDYFAIIEGRIIKNRFYQDDYVECKYTYGGATNTETFQINRKDYEAWQNGLKEIDNIEYDPKTYRVIIDN